MANEPREHQFYRGVASVPQRHRPVLPETGSFPVVEPMPPTLTDADQPFAPGRPTSAPTSGAPAPVRRRPPEPPPGMIVRRRWRRLRAGAGWTWTGLSILFFCWGIWAVSLRTGDLIGPMIALVVVLAVAAFLFVLARLTGRTVLEQSLGRERPSAWPSHLTVGVFLTLAGIGFLQQTQWIVDAWRWMADAPQQLNDVWPF